MSVESLQRCRHLMNADAIYPSFLPGTPSCQMMAFICLPPPSSANVSLKTRHLFVRRTVFNWSVRGSIIPFWRSGATTMSSSFFVFFVFSFRVLVEMGHVGAVNRRDVFKVTSLFVLGHPFIYLALLIAKYRHGNIACLEHLVEQIGGHII